MSHISVKTRNDFVKLRQEEGAAPATINRALAALRRMFALAVEAELLRYAPKIKMLPEDNTRTGFLDFEDFNRLYAAFGKDFAYVQPILRTGFFTGMRLGEILELKWGRVKMKDKMIRLENADVKNKKGRAIPMIDGMFAMFQKLREDYPDSEYVFVNSRGVPVSSFRKAWMKITKEVGLEGLLFHDLRRTAVRNLIRAGVDRKIAKGISGHKTDSTFDRYNISDERDTQDAAAKLSKHLNLQDAPLTTPTQPAKPKEAFLN